jgi:hypothetical protein
VQFVVCDNFKAAVTNPDRYDPGLNRSYAEMAAHYGTAILAARPPKDKAKVEVAVQIAQRWILARLRNQRFFALAELNATVRGLMADLNARQMRKRSRGALKPDRYLLNKCFRLAAKLALALVRASFEVQQRPEQAPNYAQLQIEDPSCILRCVHKSRG